VGGRYERERKARGFELSAVYLENNRRSLKKHILPVFGSWRLHELTPATLDAFFLELFEESTLRGATINKIMRALTVPLAEAERLGHIGRNPMRAIRNFAQNTRTRGALTQAELDALFAPDAVATVWGGDRQPMVIAMLCAGCGLRHGEAVAVRPMDIEDGILRVSRQWDRGSGVYKSPKWNSVREVPLPPRLREEIDLLVASRDIPADGVLSAAERTRNAARPDDHLGLVDALRAALVRIGIAETEQKRDRRFLDVHSLRHTYITRLRAAGVPDWEIQSAAGHKSAVMTDRYTHGRGADYTSVAAAKVIPFEKREAS
jgi:integrase